MNKLLTLALFLFASGIANASDTVWDLRPGEAVGAQPTGFVNHACGGNGGPPTIPLAGFADFASCPAEPSGLHEVYFQYDPEPAALREAWERWPLARIDGTRVYGFRAMLSALFDGAGELKGVRIIADPRGADGGERNDMWRLGAVLQKHYAGAAWTCEDAPLRPRETAPASFFVKRSCTAMLDGLQLSSTQSYYHKAGQSFTDTFGKVQNTYFVSDSRFEILLAD